MSLVLSDPSYFVRRHLGTRLSERIHFILCVLSYIAAIARLRNFFANPEMLPRNKSTDKPGEKQRPREIKIFKILQGEVSLPGLPHSVGGQ